MESYELVSLLSNLSEPNLNVKIISKKENPVSTGGIKISNVYKVEGYQDDNINGIYIEYEF